MDLDLAEANPPEDPSELTFEGISIETPSSLNEEEGESQVSTPESQATMPPVPGTPNPPPPPNPPNPNPNPPSTSPMMMINGVQVEMNQAARPAQAEIPFFKKEERIHLAQSKLMDLFDKATKNCFSRFDLMSLSLSDEHKLDDTYNIGVLIGKMKAACVRYDTHDVFTVLKLDSTQTMVLGTKDLFTEYHDLTEAEVAASNRWYATWPKSTTFAQNLNLTFEFLLNHTTDRLWEKCMEAYEEYPTEEQGGPLMFLIMIKKLVIDNESAVTYLKTKVEKMKLSDFEGEDVGRAVSLLLGAYKRLRALDKVPDDLPKKLIKIFQTSSNAKFNELFSHLETRAEIDEKLSGKANWPSVDSLLKLAESSYLEMTSTEQWSGVKKRNNRSTFVATPPTAPDKTCWNCGQKGHTLQACPKPKNSEVIDKRRKEFRTAQKKQKEKGPADGNNNRPPPPASKGKFAPPKPQEENRRVIDNVPMFWQSWKSKWVKDLRPPATPPPNPSANLATTVQQLQAQVQQLQQAGGSNTSGVPNTNPSTQGAASANVTSTNAVTNQRNALRETALNNTTHIISNALRSFSDAFSD